MATVRYWPSAEHGESRGAGRRTVEDVDSGEVRRDWTYPSPGHLTFADAECSAALRAIKTGRLDG
ncbi:hypothetical protein GCM10009799_00170 [Nocardiopsis rhodophaea]|uniref:DUF397 domain-containing protein n=1 Tax=Nocardiopsis rhodophaea TaxID=280238 RepID=A0ABN2S1Y3_9ACTN